MKRILSVILVLGLLEDISGAEGSLWPWTDVATEKLDAAFAAAAKAEVEARDRFFARNGIDNVPVATDRPYIQSIRALFKRRASKR